jgi:hypothetical protein
MTTNVYYGNDMTLSMETQESTPVTIPVGVLKQVEITATAEHDHLYGADSIKREEVKRREFGVDVSVGFAKMDIVLIEEWLGGSGSAGGSVTDSSDPQLFQVTGGVTPAGGGTTKEAVVQNVDFPEVPVITASEGEYETTELEGTGETISVTGAT